MTSNSIDRSTPPSPCAFHPLASAGLWVEPSLEDFDHFVFGTKDTTPRSPYAPCLHDLTTDFDFPISASACQRSLTPPAFLVMHDTLPPGSTSSGNVEMTGWHDLFSYCKSPTPDAETSSSRAHAQKRRRSERAIKRFVKKAEATPGRIAALKKSNMALREERARLITEINELKRVIVENHQLGRFNFSPT